MNMNINRRNLLAGAGALVVSVTLPGVKARAATSTLASRLPLKPEQLATYISINADGSAVGWVGKVDMGQGTDIGWIKMIAEELDLPTDRVSMVQGHTDVTINMGGASGSTGIWKGGAAMRNAAARHAGALVEMASEKLGVPADRLTVTDGVVSDKTDASKKVSYGELIGGRHFDVQLEWNKVIGNDLMVKGKAKPKSPSEYKTVGKPGTRRRDVAPKVLGTLEYMVDVKVPGMLHGRMIRPPVAGAVRRRRIVGEGHSRRQSGLAEGLHRRRRAEGMGRDQGLGESSRLPGPMRSRHSPARRRSTTTFAMPRSWSATRM